MAGIDPQTILSQSEALVLDLQSQVDTAIQGLQTFIDGRISYVTYPPPTAFEPSKTTPIPVGSLPTLTPAILDKDFGNPLSEIDVYKAHVFMAPTLDSMQSTILTWVQNGGIGINSDIQNALWNNNRQRRLQSLSDALDQISSRDAKRGFAYPTSRRASDAVLVQYQQDDENLNWQITSKMADLAQQNIQFAIQANIAIEQLQVTFTLGFGNMFLNLKKLIVDTFAIEANERVAEFKAQLDAIIAGYKVAEVNGTLTISYQELLLKQWEVLTTQGTDRTKSLIAQTEQATKIQLEATKSLVDTLGSTIKAALMQTTGIALDSKTSTG